MTDEQAIEAVSRGERAVVEQSRHAAEKPPLCSSSEHLWRVIACTDEQDVSECSKCGKQVLHACHFDEDYA